MSEHAPNAEDLFAWLARTGGATRSRIAGMLGAANAFKEGDVTVGVAATDEAQRVHARALLAATTLRAIDGFGLFDDDLEELLRSSRDAGMHSGTADWTLGELKDVLLTGTPSKITRIAAGLSSDAIGCVVKLLSDDELIAVSARLFHALPGSDVGAPGFLGARLQPNSPTDHPDDIRWQVFCGWAYGVGDVLLGTNPVSSDPASVARVERTLQDVIATFGLQDAIPHCVLAHVDVQAEVEREHPGSTALWFQSIAGSDAANQTFDVSVAKMLAHATTRTGRYGFYFETGQGADFTNGHARGVDMVMHESRKYGFARALTARVGDAQRSTGRAAAPWVIVNDVAGFIGPEVFRTKEQLVRCCLEDLVMGKLHGLTIGLDVCATLHMDISLDDLDWCLDRLVASAPAYLMALPTKVDPMLGYLATGFQDHVRLRTTSGTRVNGPMAEFFASLGVLNADGGPGAHFGDVLHLYTAYCRRRGDTRTDAEIRSEGAAQMAAVRGRGVFLAEGYGAAPHHLAPALDRQIRQIHDDAKLAFWATLPSAFVQTIAGAVVVATTSSSREEYILHPSTGEMLSAAALDRLAALRTVEGEAYEVQLVVSDGLNALAITEPGHLLPFLDAVRQQLHDRGWAVSPSTVVVQSGRVRAGYRIGEAIFADRPTACAIVHVIGERPGTGHNTYSAYVTLADGRAWTVPGTVDHDITRVISGIALTATPPTVAAGQVAMLFGPAAVRELAAAPTP